ncbi:MAG: NAD-dependent epimerase/dehydratase family protein, partial [Xanthobacteraceae bacterium]
MHILVTGAGGMIGHKLVERLARGGKVGGKPIERMTLHDIAAPEAPKGASFPVATRCGDIAAPGETAALVADAPGLIFHLAAVVSGEAEA